MEHKINGEISFRIDGKGYPSSEIKGKYIEITKDCSDELIKDFIKNQYILSDIDNLSNNFIENGFLLYLEVYNLFEKGNFNAIDKLLEDFYLKRSNSDIYKMIIEKNKNLNKNFYENIKLYKNLENFLKKKYINEKLNELADERTLNQDFLVGILRIFIKKYVNVYKGLPYVKLKSFNKLYEKKMNTFLSFLEMIDILKDLKEEDNPEIKYIFKKLFKMDDFYKFEIIFAPYDDEQFEFYIKELLENIFAVLNNSEINNFYNLNFTDLNSEEFKKYNKDNDFFKIIFKHYYNNFIKDKEAGVNFNLNNYLSEYFINIKKYIEDKEESLRFIDIKNEEQKLEEIENKTVNDNLNINNKKNNKIEKFFKIGLSGTEVILSTLIILKLYKIYNYTDKIYIEILNNNNDKKQNINNNPEELNYKELNYNFNLNKIFSTLFFSFILFGLYKNKNFVKRKMNKIFNKTKNLLERLK